jgi:hypothetical protein
MMELRELASSGKASHRITLFSHCLRQFFWSSSCRNREKSYVYA